MARGLEHKSSELQEKKSLANELLMKMTSRNYRDSNYVRAMRHFVRIFISAKYIIYMYEHHNTKEIKMCTV